MAGYLVEINYEVLGASRSMTLRFADGQYPDEASAQSAAASFATNYRSLKGEAITNVAAVIKETT